MQKPSFLGQIREVADGERVDPPPPHSAEPYVALMAPDWMALAALAIAHDMLERAGLGVQMERLEIATRHQMIVTHANLIRTQWREALLGDSVQPYATLQAATESEEIVRMRRVLGHTQSMLQLIAANAKDVDAPVERLAFIRGIAHGCDHFLAAEFGSVPPGTPETPT